ncbi:MAG: potassium transporter [Burkholderiales bacterium]|nr:potassium transporter [Burkholderiales bacterium]
MHNTLPLVLVLLASSVLVVAFFRILAIPQMIAYLLVGILTGPHFLGWIPDTEETRYLAEFGVVFLMFSIGLEFSLSKLLTMRRIVFGLGFSQVMLGILVTLVFTALLGVNWRIGLAVGGALAMSSTAIVSKMMAERQELHSAHGRKIFGILLFQDLAVVPLLIVIPALSHDTKTLPLELGAALLKAAAVLAVLLFLGQKMMRPWFHLVARQKSSELFMLNVLFITLGLSYVTNAAGLSMALGAFLAGMLISETEYRYQVEDDIKPFRDVLLGLFFITIGMMLDLSEVWRELPMVLLTLAALLAIKFLLVAGLCHFFDRDWGVALRTGLNLAQAGEFGFVLLSQAKNLHLISEPALQIVLAAMLISMLIAPFLIERSDQVVKRYSAGEWMNRALQLHNISVRTMASDVQIIICGYGRSGQTLARFLEQESLPFIALDHDPLRVREASAAGENVVFGDASRREVLIAAGLLRVKALVVAYSDVHSALSILNHVRELRPDLPVIVRTLDDSEMEKLRQAGAAEVVAEIMEGSMMLASHALLQLGVPLNRVLKRIRETREARYSGFRGYFRGITDQMDDEQEAMQLRLRSVMIPQGAFAVGKTLFEIDLGQYSVDITAVRRRNIRGLAPAPETVIKQGDVVVLRGTQAGLASSEIRLLQG